jgi:hypothetical protein
VTPVRVLVSTVSLHDLVNLNFFVTLRELNSKRNELPSKEIVNN